MIIRLNSRDKLYLLDRGTILIEANDRIRFGSFKVECNSIDENSHRFGSCLSACLLHIYVPLHKKKKEKPCSTFLEYVLQAFIQRLIARGGIG